MPFFSVIIPIYKAEDYLRECVDSVLGQSFTDFELLLVDDGSPDSCPAICDEYAERDERVRVIHKENGGVSSARNAGMRAAMGEYLTFLDSDDFWCEPKGLEILYDTLGKRKTDVLVFGVKKENMETGVSYPQPFYPAELNEMPTPQLLLKLLERNTLLTSFYEMAVDRKYVEENNLYLDESLPIAEDGEWEMRAMSCTPSYGFINDTIYCTRRGTNDVFRATAWERLNGMAAFLERYWSQKYENDEIKRAVLGLGAYHYTLLCAQTACGPAGPQKSRLIKQLKSLRGYWNYAAERKAGLASKASRLVGFHGTLLLLGLYMRRK
ncbi:MAG: glycosyltransferase family 2 protein [Eubacteriales bacterium]|nr:glycosyltransferase family 2 protein [Eubacteriales bacterium]